MIKPKLTLFEMQEEVLIRKSVKLSQSPFRKKPKGFYAIYVTFAQGKFVFNVKNTVISQPFTISPS